MIVRAARPRLQPYERKAKLLGCFGARLVTPDGAELRAHGLMKHWVDLDKDVNDFILRIGADDFVRMKPGVAYELVWTGDDALRWKVAPNVALKR